MPAKKTSPAAKLAEYKKKRDFKRTPEPEGRKGYSHTDRLFVIHKHAASRLHYDLRLELDGVLLSWAVPKGPSLDTANKRLAVHVEDHPLDYGGFEGIIPAGEYGGGTVMLWDRGIWIPEEDPHEGYEKGTLKFILQGEKLTGSWALFRIGKKNEDQDNWLLVKHRDDAALAPGEKDIAEAAPLSVLSGRSMEEIARDSVPADQRRQAEEPGKETGQASSEKATPDPGGLQGARKKKMPQTFRPQLARLVKEVPAGSEWLHEIKLDGYRLLAFVIKDSVRLMTRNGKDWTERFPDLCRAILQKHLPPVLLDGELVVLRRDGSSSFQALQNALNSGSGDRLVYFIFDIVHCRGYDLTDVPLAGRKDLLRRLLDGSGPGRMIRYNDHLTGRGEKFRAEVCRAGLEGIVCKLSSSPYRQTRSGSWLKIKCAKRQEFVIGGFTEPGGTRTGFGALLLGYYEKGKLRYCGRVGTGFTEQSLRELLEKLSGLERKTTPFADPPTGSEARGVRWVDPSLVAEVVFTEWTGDGRLRHPSFQGLREDKEAEQVTREEPVQTIDSKAEHPGGREQVAGVTLSNPDRILYPEQGITKLALAGYYEKIGEYILPHLAGRPLMISRCPQGRQKKCFYQKHVNESLPDTIRGISIREKQGESLYIVIDDLTGLISLVQLGALEFHPWGCRADMVEKPDRMIFDLDPGEGVAWEQVIEAARDMRGLLEELDLRSFVRTTGGNGLHVVVPLARTSGWAEMKDFAGSTAHALAGRHPEKYVETMSKSKRKGKIFLDYFRNSRGATAICSYSTRARQGAPVAVPVGWQELSGLRSADAWTVENLPGRLAALGHDPWKDFFNIRQSLSKGRRNKLSGLR